MAEAAPGEGRALYSGLLSLGYPGDPMGDFWRAADLVREHRGDSHIAAWVAADLDACEIGLLTDPWRGHPLKSWVRTRGWTDDELDAACDRLRSRGLLDGDELTAAGCALREGIETATDRHGAARGRRLGRRRRPSLRPARRRGATRSSPPGGYPARVALARPTA